MFKNSSICLNAFEGLMSCDDSGYTTLSKRLSKSKHYYIIYNARYTIILILIYDIQNVSNKCYKFS